MARIILPSNLKQSEHKLTLITNKDNLQVSTLFSDVVEEQNAQEAVTNPNAISFMYHNNVIVSILISKNAGKYRI